MQRCFVDHRIGTYEINKISLPYFDDKKMVDSEYGTDNYNSSKISIGAVIKNPEILKFVPDYLKTKQLCNCAVKKLPFVIRYAPNRYKTLKMCNRAILKNVGTLESVPD